jgi:hypothetical protein
MDVRTQRVSRLSHSLKQKMLACDRFKSIHAMRGQGDLCDGCSLPIETDDMQYELEFCGEVDSVIIRLHRECWEVWRSQ